MNNLVDDAPLVNRVDNSGLITINLESYHPTYAIKSFDIKDYLFHGLILKEKDFREALKLHDWSQYDGAVVCVYCSTDAIIPVWAFMLVSTYASKVAKEVFTGTNDAYLSGYYRHLISSFPTENYTDQKIVIKGCSDKPVPPSAYADITNKLMPFAQSIMYGEPCSTVPVFKRPRKID
jgi:hypothetical protein